MKITGSHKHDATTDGLIEMDKLGNDFDHIHLMDLWPQWQDNFADILVLSEKYN